MSFSGNFIDKSSIEHNNGYCKVDIDQDTNINGKFCFNEEQATPTAPADGNGWLYTKSDGKIYWQSFDVAETDLTSGGGGGGATDKIENASGSCSINASGDTIVSNSMDVTGNADIGRTHIGSWSASSLYSVLMNNNQSGVGDYAVIQSRYGETHLNCSTGKFLDFRINNVPKMFMNSIGNVGIGTTSPGFKLEIQGSGGSLSAPLYNYIHYPSAGWNTYLGNLWNSGTTPIGARIENGLIVKSIYQMSDERIKKDIVDVEDDEALVKLRLLKPKTYKYIDTANRGDATTIGFIAQEVREQIPEAVSLEKDYIPNIMLSAKVSSIEIISEEEESCILTTIEDHQLILGDKISIRDAKYNTIDNIKVLEVIDTKSVKIDKTFTVEESTFIDETGFQEENVIFIYGTEVDDFHSLNKGAIFTICTAALQEVDRQLQAEKAKTLLLEDTIDELIMRVSALELL